METLSAAGVLGQHTASSRKAIIKVASSVHDRFADAHAVSGSPYAMAFGSQWRDLLDDSAKAFAERGYATYKAKPGGYRLPIVNDCLLFVRRAPESADIAAFASSRTKKNCFDAAPPDPMLFDMHDEHEMCASEENRNRAILKIMSEDEHSTMPVVLVTIDSTPRRLQSITWAVATLDASSGLVTLHGEEAIWTNESVVESVATSDESFDSGTPAAPGIQLRPQAGSGSDA